MTNVEVRSVDFPSVVSDETLAALAVGSFLMRGSLTSAVVALVHDLDIETEKAFLFGSTPTGE